MRKLLFILLLTPFIILAQDITYEQTQDIGFAKQLKNDTKIGSYTTKTGMKISVGDTLIIGQAYSKKGKVKMNYVFKNIVLGDVSGTYIHDFKYLPQNYSGEKVVVQFLYVKHEKYKGYNIMKNKNEMPLYISLFVKSPKDNSAGQIKNMLKDSRKTILNIENALADGEVLNPNAPLTREEAIKKLKESKDLMELDLMDKKEYQRLKDKLTPIIMQK